MNDAAAAATVALVLVSALAIASGCEPTSRSGGDSTEAAHGRRFGDVEGAPGALICDATSADSAASVLQVDEDLGRFAFFERVVAVPLDGWSAGFVIEPGACSSRTMVEIHATIDRPAMEAPIELALYRHGSVERERYYRACFEELFQDGPPYKPCTARLVTGWESCDSRQFILRIEPVEPREYDVRLVMYSLDPLDD